MPEPVASPRVRLAENTLNYVTDYIKFADAKAGAILGLALVIGGAVFPLANGIISDLNDVPFVVLMVLTAIALVVAVSTVMAVFHSVHAVAPRTGVAGNSVVSFPDIAIMDADDYHTTCARLTSDDLAVHYERLNKTLSNIAAIKFKAIQDSVWWLRVQIFSAYCLGLLFAVIKVASA